jgi:hypothetical protein
MREWALVAVSAWQRESASIRDSDDAAIDAGAVGERRSESLEPCSAFSPAGVDDR